MISRPDHPPFRIALGRWPELEGGALSAGVPVLAGETAEVLFPQAQPAGATATFACFRAGRWLLGCGGVPAAGSLELLTRNLYAEIFAAARGWNLCRIWHYVPRINAEGPEGIENYRSFSCGRSLAFERELGPGFKQQLPAASAVGSDGDRLVVVFAATRDPAVHCENPAQIPAYEYPPEYGPRSPSFARATVAARSGGGRDVFISGTSAIKGHDTVAPGHTRRQVECTLENLRTISQVCGLGHDLAAGRAAGRHFKIYLRHERDLEPARTRLEHDLLTAADRVSYLRADICRATLNVEIEATILGAPD